MFDKNNLTALKTLLGITGTAQDGELIIFIDKMCLLLMEYGVSPFLLNEQTITETVYLTDNCFVTQFPINSIISIKTDDCGELGAEQYQNCNWKFEFCDVEVCNKCCTQANTCRGIPAHSYLDEEHIKTTLQYEQTTIECCKTPYQIQYKTGYSIDWNKYLNPLLVLLWNKYGTAIPSIQNTNCNPNIKSKSADDTKIEYFDPSIVQKSQQTAIYKFLKPFLFYLTPRLKSKSILV
jgi:hypothetical protein